MVREVAQQGFELVARKPGIAERDAIALKDAVQQPQAVGTRPRPVVRNFQGTGKVGLARTAGDEHAAFARPGGQLVEEIGQTAALVVGVGAALLGRSILIELWQHAFVVVPHHQHRSLLDEFDGPPALLGGRKLMEIRHFTVFAEDGNHAFHTGKLLKADKARSVAEQSAARPPQGGLRRQRGLAHAAHRMQHDAAIAAKSSFQIVKLLRPALETILRRPRKRAGLPVVRWRAESSPATGILSVTGADVTREQCGILVVLRRIGEIHPQQPVEVRRKLERFELHRK